MGDGLVQARGLRKSFGGFEAVRGLDVDVEAGQIFGFLGPNGAGKSSTMRMIACVSPRSAGFLQVLGMDPDVDGPRIRARIGVVPQLDNLDTELTVRENLEIYGRYFGLSRPHVRRKAVELMGFAQLGDRADAAVESLSGGMKRRLTIARSLVNDPELLLLDEPTTGLDPQARHLLWDRLYRLKGEGVTQIVTTHYMDEAEQLCDRLVVMDHGRIAAEGSPRELIERYSTREVLEIRFAPDGEDRKAAAASLAALVGTGERGAVERIEELPDRILLYSQDGEASLAAVHGAGTVPVASLVRRSSLEDVFLHLTGRTLVD
jgi:lipooligosaccharide transport system ATP-binding protein